MGILYIIATPIGNLEDLSLRACRILKEVDLILCEDTRITKKLLNHYKIETSVLSYHQHSGLSKMIRILGFLKEDKNIALVTDNGTPGISDPGNKLINFLEKENKDLVICPIPGPSAMSAIASICGFPMDRFLFLGFPPSKKKRKRFFEQVLESKYPVILYESPHRILKSLNDLNYLDQEIEIVVGRELTKKFERVYRGNIQLIIEELEKDKIRGEFVIVVNKKK